MKKDIDEIIHRDYKGGKVQYDNNNFEDMPNGIEIFVNGNMYKVKDALAWEI